MAKKKTQVPEQLPAQDPGSGGAAIATAAEATFHEKIPLRWISPHPKNRKINEHDPKFLELKESIASVGVLVPVLLRPIGFFTVESGKSGREQGFFVLDYRKMCGSGEYGTRVGGRVIAEPFGTLYKTRQEAEDHCSRYELMAGERRWRAAKAAGLTEIPAIVREMTDLQALEVMISENMQRADLGPIEEARALSALLEVGYTPADAAAKLGKSTSWIATRSLLADLIPEFLDAFQGCGAEVDEGAGVKMIVDLSRWSVRGMELIARLPRETQSAIWKEQIAEADQWDMRQIANYSTNNVESLIERFTRLIKHATWDKSKKFDVLPPCKGCPRSSQANPDLFEDEAPKDARCLDPECWEKKEKAHAASLLKKAESEHGEVLKVSKSYSTKTAGVIGYEHYNLAAKGDAGAKPAVIVEGDMPKFVYVKLYKNSGSTPGAPAEKTVATKKAQHDKLRRRILIGLIIEELPCAMHREFEKLSEAAKKRLIALALAFGFGHSRTSTYYGAEEWKEAWTLLDAPGDDLWSKMAAEVEAQLKRRLEDAGKGDEPEMHEAFSVCNLLDIDIEGLYETACERKPYPKSWAKEAAEIETPPLHSFIKKRSHPYIHGKSKTQSGTCRYCGCTDEHGCDGGCSWVNEEHTVCSNPECVAQMEEDELDAMDAEADELNGEDDEEEEE